MLRLPIEDGSAVSWQPSGVTPVQPRPGGFRSRIAYAAAHVVAADASDRDAPSSIDWGATLGLRSYLWDLGLGVAEAMDTAQRGGGLGPEMAEELMARTAEMAADSGASVVYGATTDRLDPVGQWSLRQIADAYGEQIHLIESLGGTAVVMPSRQLAASASGPDDYHEVYRSVVEGASRPVLIHWLGGAFDPNLDGYWGTRDVWRAAGTVLKVVTSLQDKVSGVKLSVLDDELEISMRRRLPAGVRMYTGDDLNYVDLIAGDGIGHSDALLGVLGPIAPAAVAAFQALDEGDMDAYRRILEATLPMARHLFSHPTHHYKTGVAFLAYMNGLQPHFRMLGGAEGARSLPHLARLLVLADEAGLLLDPDLAQQRMRGILEGQL